MKFKSKKIVFILLILILCIGILAGCNNAKIGDNVSVAPEKSGVNNPEQSTAILSDTSDRKLIYYIYYDLDVDNASETAKNIRALTTAKGGYVENSSESGTENRYVNLVVRIPIAEVDSFLNSIAVMGSVTNNRIESQDVTAQIQTFDEKLAKLNAQLTRYKAIDRTGFTFSENMLIEDKIAETEGQIDFYESQKESLSAKVEYSTVTISLNQKYSEAKKPFGIKLKDSFIASLKSVGDVFKFIVNILVLILPYVVIVGIIVLVIFLIKRKRKKGKN